MSKPRTAPSPDAAIELAVAACRLIDASGERAPALAELATQLGVSPSHLHRSFRRAIGVTPRQYADQARVERLKRGLRAGESVATATYAAGFGSSSRVYEDAAGRLGMTPRRFRDGGPGEKVAYAVVPCALGRLLVAGTERGICAVALGDRVRELERGLRDLLPQAELSRDAALLEPWVAQLVRFLDGHEAWPELPIDVRGTAFQRRVWQCLRDIPPGETRSYAEVAAAIGQPRAARAVAQACAQNPAALAVPCHRVVRSDGGDGGYRWGRKRKRRLLDLEGATPPTSAPGSPRRDPRSRRPPRT